MSDFNIIYMKEALKQAKKAYALGETPIGAVIVRDGEIIARACNRRETKKCVTYHAEILAIEKACKKLGGWRLPSCDLYVTMEPCPMCAGAIVQARIDNVYFGAYDGKYGCCGSKTDLFKPGLFYYNVNCTGGIMEDECSGLLKDFFKTLRESKKKLRGENNEL